MVSITITQQQVKQINAPLAKDYIRREWGVFIEGYRLAIES